jgi:RNA-directed DNA polymerase
VGTDPARGRGTAGKGGSKKRMPSCNGADSPNGQSERMLTCFWSSIEGELSMVHNADISTTSEEERPADAIGTGQWKGIDFQKAEADVKHLQRRISKAYIDGKTSLAKRLSYLLVNSWSAKVLAVRRVSEQNQGRHTPGVDGKLWLTDKQKMDAVNSLNKGRYRAKPLRRIYIPKKNGKLRPLSIPTMYDRAMQALYALALDPIQEATADPNSYGFRIGRSCQDAMGEIQLMMASSKRPEWVLEGDIKGCFDNISHDWMMENIPMDKAILKQFIKSGFVFGERLFPTERGSPQGGVISPILANMVLNGMERIVKENFPRANLTRFADDFVVVLDSPKTAEKVKDLLIGFLGERGLELSEEKTLITHIDDGFDFLGWNFKKHRNQKRKVLIIKPSKQSLHSMMDGIKETVLVQGKAWTQDQIIEVLNPKLRGWCNYHSAVMSSKTFDYLDAYLFRTLYSWGLHRHNDKGKCWVLDRYWHPKGARKYEFCTDKNQLFRPCDMKMKRHVKTRNGMNPYIDTEYFQERQKFRKYERGYRDKSFAM